ncbi:MAG: hypothetical protein AAF485_20760 [Chloroflexota bacterium]
MSNMRTVSALSALFFVTACSQHSDVDNEMVRGFEVLPNQTLLVVKVKSSEYTGLYPYDCPEDKCIPFYFWFVYKADVLDVVNGDFEEKSLTFAALHHTYYAEKVTDNWYVLIEKFDEKPMTELGVQYRVIKHDARAFHSE